MDPDEAAIEASGALVVALARRAVESALGSPTPPGPRALPAILRAPRGVFVTLRRFPGDRLRGCIGFPLPVRPLADAVREAAVAAATEDPRFPPVRADELPRLTFEVSVLTRPEVVRAGPDGPLDARVEVGRDGLIVEGGGAHGLLLPQVATEERWTATEFLDGTCRKAGLPAGAWRDPRVTVRAFRAVVFGERSPNGGVERVVLTPGASPGRSAPTP
ncbi:MAG TPA: AmmeMemoRadiSam system protein A [Thermoplasmata archaeon]|nr:AmmeMemoRadiSam system protein A [Thermoplasmata archaeon]